MWGWGFLRVPVPQSLAVNPAATSLIKIAQEQVYTASIRFSTGTENTVTAIWQSDNQNVASVDGSGKAVGLDSGEATLIAHAEGLTGTLKIRVVPDYVGTWDGEYVIRACRASGDFNPKDWCSADAFKPGQRLPITFALTQDRDRLSGTLYIGSLEHTLDASSAIRVDGGAAMSGTGSYTAEDVRVDTTISPVTVRASGPSLTGNFTLTFVAGGASALRRSMVNSPRCANGARRLSARDKVPVLQHPRSDRGRGTPIGLSGALSAAGAGRQRRGTAPSRTL
jgi:hypothetical protein